jgi:hypothetical protein
MTVRLSGMGVDLVGTAPDVSYVWVSFVVFWRGWRETDSGVAALPGGSKIPGAQDWTESGASGGAVTT